MCSKTKVPTTRIQPHTRWAFHYVIYTPQAACSFMDLMKCPARKNKDLLPLRLVVSIAQINVIATLRLRSKNYLFQLQLRLRLSNISISRAGASSDYSLWVPVYTALNEKVKFSSFLYINKTDLGHLLFSYMNYD